MEDALPGTRADATAATLGAGAEPAAAAARGHTAGTKVVRTGGGEKYWARKTGSATTWEFEAPEPEVASLLLLRAALIFCFVSSDSLRPVLASLIFRLVSSDTS